MITDYIELVVSSRDGTWPKDFEEFPGEIDKGIFEKEWTEEEPPAHKNSSACIRGNMQVGRKMITTEKSRSTRLRRIAFLLTLSGPPVLQSRFMHHWA